MSQSGCDGYQARDVNLGLLRGAIAALLSALTLTVACASPDDRTPAGSGSGARVLPPTPTPTLTPPPLPPTPTPGTGAIEGGGSQAIQELDLEAILDQIKQRSEVERTTRQQRVNKVLHDANALVELLNNYWTVKMSELYGYRFQEPLYVEYYEGTTMRSCGTDEFDGSMNAYYCGAPGDEHIAFDLNWFQEMLIGYPGGATTFLVLAHEWGHAVQHTWLTHGGGDYWSPEYRRELNADCLAGVFLGEAFGRGWVIEDPDDADAISHWLSQGEGPWFVPTTHGTPAQRKAAFTDGLHTLDVHDCRMRY